MTSTITYARLDDGSWGVRGANLVPGAVVEVAKRDGTTQQETVGRVVRRSQGVMVATIARRGSVRAPGAPAPTSTRQAAASPPAEARERDLPLEPAPVQVHVQPVRVVRTARGLTLHLMIEVWRTPPPPGQGPSRVQ